MDLNYEEDIRIDETALDVEWLNQASLMMRYAANASNCEHDLDLAKSALDLVKSDLDKRIRAKPEAFKIDVKLTEPLISNTIIAHSDYKGVFSDYLEAKHAFNIAKNAVTAIHQRKDALEYLVRLFGQQYFAGPSMPRDLHFEASQKGKAVDLKIAASMKKEKRLKRKKK